MNEQTYKMRDDFDCGIAALSFSTGKSYETLKEIWGWKNTNTIKDNLLDSPWHHDNVLYALQIPHATVDENDIMNMRCENGKTMILLHFAKSGKTRNFIEFIKRELQGILQQHWVVLHSVVNGFVLVHWGDGTIRSIPFETFKNMYKVGWPNCAYQLNVGTTNIPWYVKWWAKITGKFVSCIS